MLTRERQIEIEIAVVELLEDYDFRSYPISVGELLVALQVNLVPFSGLDAREKEIALLASKDKAFNVTSHDYVRAQVVFDDTRGAYFSRSRFSGGHETGHVWLEHEEDTLNREEEADYFAGYLLAPHPLILTMHDPSVVDVADAFCISEPCASVAIDQAGVRRYEGIPWRPHEKWLLKNVHWKGVVCLEGLKTK